jgi:lactate dehydrogenase-like 2-hydroxyacid dehydrogenase
MKKCLVISTSKEFSQNKVDELAKKMEIVWKKYDKISESELITELSADKWDILAISPDPLQWEIPASFYENLGTIKNICLPTTSYECFDIPHLKKLAISLSNIPHYSTNAVAEQALFMTMGLLRRLPEQIRTSFVHKYSDENLGEELEGKIVGIIGLGAIGSKIAEKLQNLGNQVIYWSPHSRNEKYKFVSLEDLLTTSDFIFPTYKINTETTGFLDKNKLPLIKSSGSIVNISGEMAWDTELVLTMVQDGNLNGVAFESTKIKMTEQNGNILILPPLAWYTKESQLRTFSIWYDNIFSCTGNNPTNLV